MKVKDLKVVIPVFKPRNSVDAILAGRKNAAGKHTDKKRAQKIGDIKHKVSMFHEDDLNENIGYYLLSSSSKVLAGPFTTREEAMKSDSFNEKRGDRIKYGFKPSKLKD